MAAEEFNSLGGYSVGIPPVPVIDANGNVITNVLVTSGNVSASKIYANNYYYSNGAPFTAGGNPGGSNNSIQFNGNGTFSGSNNFTFNPSSTLLTTPNLNVTGYSNLGSVTNVTITGGISGYLLTTDGQGLLNWAPPGSGSAISNGQSNVSIGTYNGNITASVNGNANIIIINENGLVVKGNVTSNTFTGNLIGRANTVVDNAQPNITSVGTLISLNVTGNINANTFTGNLIGSANTVVNNAQPNITSVGTLTSLAVTGNITGGDANLNGSVTANYFIGDGSYLSNIQAANIVGQVANALIAGRVYINAQPNITSVGTLTSLAVTGNITGGNANVIGNITAGNANVIGNITAGNANVIGNITAGNANLGNLVTANYIHAVLNTTSGSQPNITSVGNLSNLTVGNATSNVVTNNGNIVATGNITALNFIGNFSGNVPIPGSNTGVVFNDQGNANTSTSFTFNKVSNVVTVTGNITSGNANLGNAVTANYFVGSGNNLSNIQGANVTGAVTYATNANAVAGANVSGQVGNSLIAGTVYTNAQPNITSVGTLTGLTVAGDLLPNANVIYNLGSPTKRWKDLFISGNTIDLNGSSISADANGITLANPQGGTFTVQGTGAANSGAILSGSSSIIIDANSNINLSVSGVSNVVVISTQGLLVNGNANITNNVVVGQTIVATGNITGSNLKTANGLYSNTANITANLTSGNANLGNLATANYINVVNQINGNIANFSGNLTAANASLGNLVTANYVNVSNQINGNTANFSGNLTAANASLGNLATANYVNISANLTSGNASLGNLATANYVNVANQINGNIANFSGNLTAANASLGNLVTANYVNVSNQINGNIANFSGNLTAANASLGNLVTANYLTGTITTNAQPNVTSVGSLTGLTVSNATGTVNFTTTANVTLGAVANVHITGGSSGYVLSTDGSGGLSWIAISSSSISNGNSNISIPTSNGNINLTAGGTTSMVISSTGTNVNGTLNVTGNTNTGNLSTTNLVVTGAGSFGANVNMNTYWINNVGYPNLNSDVATKQYVDTLVSSGISYHPPVTVATTTTLAVATGGTTSYVSPNGAANGIGAYISTTGTYLNIDSANVQTVGTRILVKDEANATWNGVYTYANTTAIVRATDADQYGPNSVEELSVNDFFFTQGGIVNEGVGFIVSAPAGIITFGTSNITFSIFTTAQVYDAGTGLTLTGTTFSVNASQTQITSVGSLTGLTVSNATGTVNFVTTSNVSLGAVANLHVTGGSNGYVLSTDGSGNLSWVGISSSSISNGNSNVSIPVSNGNVNINSGGNATLVVTNTGANINGTLNPTGLVTISNTSGGATSIALGNPTQGNLISNAIVFSNSSSVSNAIAQLNQILGKLVPPAPPTFPASQTIAIQTLSTYRMSNYVQTDNTPGANKSVAGGTTVTNVTRTALYSTGNITTAGPGDSGTVTVYLNGADAGNRTLTTSINGNGTYSNLVIYNNYDYNSANANIPAGFWYVFSSRTAGTITQGWNEVYITQSAASSSNTPTWFYDSSNPGTPSFSSLTMLPPVSPSYTYSSTIPHYVNTNQFTLTANVNKLSGNMYPTSDNFVTGTAGGAFNAPSSVTYAAASITTPLAQNLYVSSGNASISTTATIVSGFGSNSVGPSLSSNNSYNSNTQAFTTTLNAIVLFKTGTTTAIDETSIVVTSLGTGSGNGYRIINSGSSNTPAFTGTEAAFNSQTSTLQTYDAVVVGSGSGGLLKHDQTNYATGYLPVGPNLSTGRTGTQYFTFKVVRSDVSKFKINFTGNIAGMWVALPGSVFDTTIGSVGPTSTINGWLDMTLAAGSGVPGANTGTGGNGSNGCSEGGAVVPNSNGTQARTCTFGTISSSSTPTNEIYIRIALTAGQSLTALNLQAAT